MSDTEENPSVAPPVEILDRGIPTVTMASFADAESALEKFDGRNKPVGEWFAAYEGIAAEHNFTQSQRYFFCRRLLCGTARLAVEAENDLTDFVDLKAFLTRRFARAVSSADVYRTLTVTRANRGESAEDFAYRMKGIAKHITLGESALVDFIVEGLPGSPVEKSRLYGIATFDELLIGLESFSRMMSAAQKVAHASQPGRGPAKPLAPTAGAAPAKASSAPGGSGSRTCYTCGKPGHVSRECRAAMKCEKCKRTGHQSADCRMQSAGTVTCFKCGVVGHKANTCTAPRREA